MGRATFSLDDERITTDISRDGCFAVFNNSKSNIFIEELRIKPLNAGSPTRLSATAVMGILTLQRTTAVAAGNILAPILRDTNDTPDAGITVRTLGTATGTAGAIFSRQSDWSGMASAGLPMVTKQMVGKYAPYSCAGGDVLRCFEGKADTPIILNANEGVSLFQTINRTPAPQLCTISVTLLDSAGVAYDYLIDGVAGPTVEGDPLISIFNASGTRTVKVLSIQLYEQALANVNVISGLQVNTVLDAGILNLGDETGTDVTGLVKAHDTNRPLPTGVKIVKGPFLIKTVNPLDWYSDATQTAGTYRTQHNLNVCRRTCKLYRPIFGVAGFFNGSINALLETGRYSRSGDQPICLSPGRTIMVSVSVLTGVQESYWNECTFNIDMLLSASMDGAFVKPEVTYVS